MNETQIYICYVTVMAILGLVAFTIPSKVKGALRVVQSIASVLFILVAIPTIILTIIYILGKIAPNLGAGGNGSGSNEQDYNTYEPFGGY